MSRRSYFPLLLFVLIAAAASAQIDTTLAEMEQGASTYFSTCATCHGEDGAGVPNANFSRGLPRVSSESDFFRILREGIAGTAMPKFQMPEPRMRALLKYLRSLSESVAHSSAAGDPVRGKTIFEGKGACLSCHRVGASGSRLGPSLTEIGKRRTITALEESLLEPNAVVQPEYWFLTAVTRDGAKVSGRRLNEDRNTIQLIDASSRLLSFARQDLREHTIVRTSQMPSYKGKLAADELRDVIKYLTTLRGQEALSSPDPFAASTQESSTPRQH